MSEAVNIHLNNSNEIINIVELDGKVWMTKWFISDAPDEMDWAQPLEPADARELAEALLKASEGDRTEEELGNGTQID